MKDARVTPEVRAPARETKKKKRDSLRCPVRWFTRQWKLIGRQSVLEKDSEVCWRGLET